MALFAAEGFRCDGVRTERRTVVNRASGVAMNRLWVQACFIYTGPALPTLCSRPCINADALVYQTTTSLMMTLCCACAQQQSHTRRRRRSASSCGVAHDSATGSQPGHSQRFSQRALHRAAGSLEAGSAVRLHALRVCHHGGIAAPAARLAPSRRCDGCRTYRGMRCGGRGCSASPGVGRRRHLRCERV